MPITINGSGTLTGISAGGLPDGTVQPADLSTGAPSWTSGGDLSFNSGYGSVATAYGCRAWVNFDGTTASPSTIRGSGNVSSVTKTGTGTYTVNLTNAMPDANYTIVACAGWAALVNILSTFTTSTIPVVTGYFSNTTGSASSADNSQVYISIFR